MVYHLTTSIAANKVNSATPYTICLGESKRKCLPLKHRIENSGLKTQNTKHVFKKPQIYIRKIM